MNTPADAAETSGMTVGQAASRLGVTVRTLHHWDEIGLASPSLRTHGGYRLYTAADIALLQRAVVYRELGLPLDAIRELLHAQAVDPTVALRTQRNQVQERIARLNEMTEGLDRMIQAHEQGILLTAEQQAAAFGPDWQPEWVLGARERWRDTPQWAEYAERAAARGPEDWKAIAEANSALEIDLGRAMQDGVVPGSPEANRLAEQHREAFSAYFHLTHEMQVCIGRMYREDPGFTAHFDRVRPGLADWLGRVIDANAQANGIDPGTAAWR
ncbi:MerR family transcriptional regulator [Streptomyces abyssalis]|uniref:MerR family transcriptional regulator n=1 Tax=Streptomyces abyssalis TaxID=933944 RepID=A0A1E7JQ62_9ACTN|nr:MerR family transcriptional regulator [Streptomyces abyssalis]OEU90408.1 MerR family transcriptional regulator [Streptomyces abyssalis]OEU95144.1 MerR family transcriptional regulator [Streptomyces abyssalis]OEV30982.1 MerR family transcriptional regulator [Streptomyces nanshensis]